MESYLCSSLESGYLYWNFGMLQQSFRGGIQNKRHFLELLLSVLLCHCLLTFFTLNAYQVIKELVCIKYIWQNNF